MYSFPPLLDTSSSLFAYLCVFLSIIIHHRPEYIPDHAEHHIFNDWLLTIAGISNQRSKKPPRLRIVQPVEKGKPVKIKHHAGHLFLCHGIPPFCASDLILSIQKEFDHDMFFTVFTQFSDGISTKNSPLLPTFGKMGCNRISPIFQSASTQGRILSARADRTNYIANPGRISSAHQSAVGATFGRPPLPD